MAAEPTSFLTPTEAARLLMVSPVTLRQWAQKGLINAKATVGGHRRFALADLEAFAAERGISLANAAPERGETLLIVDDDRQLNGYLTALFTTRVPGITIRNAYDGFEAGRQVSDFKPAVVLLDIMMPGIDGLQVCESLKATPATADIRVVGMTGHHSPELETRILAAGAEVLLRKPFEAAEAIEACGFASGNPTRAAPG
ncbi:MAG: response regulator [Pseudomonadaceae bacterium]|nr:response regulator [Pseudomonadaceae bacterium]